jgi:hypothetical protein
MANSNDVLVPEIWAAEALRVLKRQSVMARLVNRDYEDKIARFGDTVNITLPGSFVVNEKAAGSSVTIQDAASTSKQVVLQYHSEVSFLIEDVENAKSITDLVELYLAPAMVAHAAKLDDRLLGLYTDIVSAGNVVGSFGQAANKQVIVDAGELMNANLVDKEGRTIVWHHESEADLMASDFFMSKDYEGQTAEWTLPRKLGFNHQMDQGTKKIAGTPNQIYNLAFTREAFALVTRPLPLPGNGIKAANVEVDGVSFRVIISYNPDRLGWQVTIDILYGVKTVRPEMAVVIRA